MALVQTASSFRVDHGTLGSWDPGAVTILLWLRVNALPGTSGWPNSRYLVSKDSAAGPEFRALYVRFDSVGNISFERSSYSGGSFPWATYRTNTTPLASTGEEAFVAVTLAASGTGRGKIYKGNRTTPATAQTLGTNTDIGGTPDDLSAVNWRLGNNGGVSLAADASYSMMAVFDSVLTEAEIQAWQFGFLTGAAPKLYAEYGLLGTGTQLDWSGNGYDGTVTSGAVADHAPIVPAWQAPRVWRASPATAAALAAAIAGSGTAAGALTTLIRLQGAGGGDGVAAGALTTAIRLVGAGAGSGVAAGSLATAIALRASIGGDGAALGDLLTAIALRGAASGAASGVGALTHTNLPQIASVIGDPGGADAVVAGGQATLTGSYF